jgi:hypothetical protein
MQMSKLLFVETYLKYNQLKRGSKDVKKIDTVQQKDKVMHLCMIN